MHVVHEVFEDGDVDWAILVDATNAFNCLNRQTALINIMNLCPALSKVLINTYRQYIPLFIEGESILSKEGTTQGDLLPIASVCCCHYTIDISPC